MITLKGITWDHSRGHTPLVACCQRYGELHPHVQVQWHKRSLQAFADYSVEALAKQYDLLIIDHPSVGEAFESNCLIDFKQHISKPALEELQAHAAGASFNSYTWNAAQLALPVDAATPVSCYRKDLLEEKGIAIPQTWHQLLALAAKGKVAIPAIPIDMLMNFYMFCIACGNEPFTSRKEIISEAVGVTALQLMLELYGCIDKKFFSCNPIAVAELMSSTNDYWYCPFAYGYSNYARKNYASHQLTYDDVVRFLGNRFSTTLGGTGIAVSAYSRHVNDAVHIAAMLTSESIQKGLYVDHGGQPAHVKAWQCTHANAIASDYFNNTLPALQAAFVRPRYNGYLKLQEEAGFVLHEFIQHRSSSPCNVIQQLNRLYRKSLPTYENSIVA